MPISMVDVAGIEHQDRLDAVDRGFLPVRLHQKAGNDVSDIQATSDQKDFLHTAIISLHHQKPDRDGADGHGNVAADVKQLQRTGDARKFGDDVAEIRNHQRDHHEEGGAQAEFFADQIGQAFAGDRAHARAHFLRDDQQERDGDQRPQRQVAVFGAGLRIGEDAAGIVIDVGGDESRADDGQKDRDLVAKPFQHALLFPQKRNDFIGGDHAREFAFFVDHRQRQQVVFIE